MADLYGSQRWPSRDAFLLSCMHMVSQLFHLTSHCLVLLCVVQSAAPYSSVFRPSQTFRSLVSGNSTAAGAGGSRGIWTLAVADKATGDLSR